jgi:hypothetical protein
MVLREEGDEGAILFDPDTGAVRILNPTAAAIWKLLAEGRALPEVLAALPELFEDVDEDVQDQVLQLTGHLVRIGALRLEEEAT